MDSISCIAGHSGEVPVGGVAASIAIGSISGNTGPAGEVPARGVPVPIVGGGIPPVVLTVGEVSARVTPGGWHASPPGVGGMHHPCSPCPHSPCRIRLWVSRLGPLRRWDHQHALTRLSDFLPF